jgi:hypothetical protein
MPLTIAELAPPSYTGINNSMKNVHSVKLRRIQLMSSNAQLTTATCTVWNTNIIKVTTVMTELDTPIQLQEALITRLQDWRNDSALVPNPLWTPAICTLIHAQDTIGWKNFLEGLPSRLWSLHMSHHYTSIGSTLCPDRWLLKVQLALHHLAWSQ